MSSYKRDMDIDRDDDVKDDDDDGFMGLAMAGFQPTATSSPIKTSISKKNKRLRTDMMEQSHAADDDDDAGDDSNLITTTSSGLNVISDINQESKVRRPAL